MIDPDDDFDADDEYEEEEDDAQIDDEPTKEELREYFDAINRTTRTNFAPGIYRHVANRRFLTQTEAFFPL